MNSSSQKQTKKLVSQKKKKGKGNRFLKKQSKQLLKTRLVKLSQLTKQNKKKRGYQTQEEYLQKAIGILQEAAKYSSLLQEEIALYPDQLPDIKWYNNIWQQILIDLSSIFEELERLERLTVFNFNFITTEANRLSARLKSVTSKMGDYSLYSTYPLSDMVFFGDSFNNLDRVDANSALLNKEECTVHQVEGLVTLPINVESTKLLTVKEISILSGGSNGQIGNNHEINKTKQNKLTTIIDNNADTWFEYEKVVNLGQNVSDPLTLELLLNLGEPQVVNHIRINPNNFGTKTVVRIEQIDTSLDGKTYISIKDEISIAGFTAIDEENVFVLAPSTSKFAGQGLYQFTPRKVKYIKLILSQNEAYTINTTSGQKLRYAIGIRDIDIYSYVFLPEGELISATFSLDKDISKVSLITNQNPTQVSELGSINYSISPDEGANWYPIQPQNIEGLSGQTSDPEILDFNGASDNTIITNSPVVSLRLKASFKREDLNFTEGSSTFQQSVIARSEMHAIPTDSPFQIILEKAPVKDSVQLIDPFFGSCGIPKFPYILGHGEITVNQRVYYLPFAPLARPPEKVLADSGKYFTRITPTSDWIHVLVGGEEWSPAPENLDHYVADWDTLDVKRYYVLNPKTGKLSFGNDDTTMAPGSDEPVVIYFEPDRLFPIGDNHIAKLTFSTSSNKDDFVLQSYGQVDTTIQVLPRNATIIQLEQRNITNYDNITSTLGCGPEEFINGRDEFTTSGVWSIDTEYGVLYLRNPTSDAEDTVISYSYQPITTIGSEAWDWATTTTLRDSILIKAEGWKTNVINEEVIVFSNNSKIFELANLNIVEGTLSFQLLLNGEVVEEDSHCLLSEVAYIDGHSELDQEIVDTWQNVGALYQGLNYIVLNEKAFVTSNFPITVSGPLFLTEVFSTPTIGSVGEYFIDTTHNQIVVSSDRTYRSDTGKIGYFYEKNLDTEGLYSVDYQLGKVYLQRALNSNWTLYANYNYTDYRAKYRIARKIDSISYDVDLVNRVVRLKDKELLDLMSIPKDTLNSSNRYYLVNYEYVDQVREDIVSIKDYFSPILKDYVLKILPRGNIL